MARNGSGTYSLLVNSWNPAVGGVSATTADWQALINDVATALTGSLAADGQTALSGNLNFNSNKATNLGSATGSGHAIVYGQSSWSLAAGTLTGALTATSATFSGSVGTGALSATTGAFTGYLTTAGVISPVRSTVASVAGTVDLTVNAANTDDIAISGTNAITAFTVAAGRVIRVTATGAFTLTNNANIVTQTGANIVAASGDTFVLRATAANTVEVLFYATTSRLTAATQAQQEAATSNAVAVTPGTQQYHPSAAKAWCVFDGTGANGAVSVPSAQQYNITSVTKNGAGDYTVVVTTAFSSAQYATAINASNSTAAVFCFVAVATTPTSTTIRINVRDITATATNSDRVSVIMFGDQP